MILTKNHYSITLLDSNASHYTRFFRWLFQQLSFWKIFLIQISHIHSLLTSLTIFIGVAHIELPTYYKKMTKQTNKKTCTTDQSFKIPSIDFQLQTSLTTEESVRLKDSSASAPRVKSLITPIPSIHPIYRIATHLLNTFWPCLDFPSPLISPDSFPLSPHFLLLFLFSFFFLYFSFH